MDLERFDRILKIRLAVSTTLYAAFVGVGLHGVIAGWHFDNPTPAVLLLVVSYLICPRRAHPKGWEPEEPESTEGRQQARARNILLRRLNRIRLFYFAAAVFVLALLPWMMGEPVFKVFG